MRVKFELTTRYSGPETVTAVFDTAPEHPRIIENIYNEAFYDTAECKVHLVAFEYPETEPETVKCAHCGIEVEHYLHVDHFDSPFDKAPNENDSYFCSNVCLDAFDGHVYSKDFAYFECDVCGRTICEQNPGNGWHVQYRDIDIENGEKICLDCYEKDILENGIPAERFENGIPGMFAPAAAENGYKVHDVIRYYKVNGEASVDFVRNTAIALIQAGNKVLIDYESMAIGGSEGYVTLWYK